MNGQIVLYMEYYLPICSNRLSNFIVQTGAIFKISCQFRWLFLCNKRGKVSRIRREIEMNFFTALFSTGSEFFRGVSGRHCDAPNGPNGPKRSENPIQQKTNPACPRVRFLFNIHFKPCFWLKYVFLVLLICLSICDYA